MKLKDANKSGTLVLPDGSGLDIGGIIVPLETPMDGSLLSVWAVSGRDVEEKQYKRVNRERVWRPIVLSLALMQPTG